MQTSAPQPTLKRAVSLLWFPFFFAGAFSLMGLFAFTHPVPHVIPVQVVGSISNVVEVEDKLERLAPNGFDVAPAHSVSDAREALVSNETAAVFVPAEDGGELYVASAASSTRAGYLHGVFTRLIDTGGGQQLTYVDLVPLAPGDMSGVGIMFYGLPLLLVGLISSIVLLQLGAWSIWKKLAVIAATGAFADAFAFLSATALEVIPVDPWLLLYGFLLTQAIGWLTTAVAMLAKHYFMPISMTFVLILGIPSSGATVNGDMLPGLIRWRNAFLPFAQFVDVTRASAYFSSHGLAAPLLLLCVWAAAGALLLFWASARARFIAPAVGGNQRMLEERRPAASGADALPEKPISPTKQRKVI